MSISLTSDSAGVVKLPRRVLIRTDASLEIGSGHVMRCLSLADALRVNGVHCQFMCREHPGNLIALIRARGFAVQALPTGAAGGDGSTAHAAWLGASVREDIKACLPILRNWLPDWLLVDHYALEATWEAAIRPYCQRLLVIDDLADRRHVCDLLLDQNLGRRAGDYFGLVPPSCRLLIGSEFALLRTEFATWREESLRRRRSASLQRLLITLGGGDKDNWTRAVLQSLKHSSLPQNCVIDVVLGTQSPWLEDVCANARELPWTVMVEKGVDDMARRMALADLAIGAAGGSSWERCCLGVPTLLLVIAANQYPAASALQEAGAALLLPSSELSHALPESLALLQREPWRLEQMSLQAAGVCSGAGVSFLVKELLEALT